MQLESANGNNHTRPMALNSLSPDGESGSSVLINPISFGSREQDETISFGNSPSSMGHTTTLSYDFNSSNVNFSSPESITFTSGATTMVSSVSEITSPGKADEYKIDDSRIISTPSADNLPCKYSIRTHANIRIYALILHSWWVIS